MGGALIRGVALGGMLIMGVELNEIVGICHHARLIAVLLIGFTAEDI